jgi:hypothetical protein
MAGYFIITPMPTTGPATSAKRELHCNGNAKQHECVVMVRDCEGHYDQRIETPIRDAGSSYSMR